MCFPFWGSHLYRLFSPMASLNFRNLTQCHRKERKVCHWLHCTFHQGLSGSDVSGLDTKTSTAPLADVLWEDQNQQP